MRSRRGFALAELAAIIVVIAMVAVVVVPACAPATTGPNVKILKDATQMKMIHQAWTIYAN